MVAVYDGKVRVKNQPKQNAEIRALVAAMLHQRPVKQPPANVPPGAVPAAPAPAAGALTYQQAFQRIGNALDETLITIPDTFLGTYSAANLPVKGRDSFLVDSVWASIGHRSPPQWAASFGSSRRPLVICGDGGFHMTAQSLSTMVRYGRNPIVVLIANGIFGFEQFLLDPQLTSGKTATRLPVPTPSSNQWDFVEVRRQPGRAVRQDRQPRLPPSTPNSPPQKPTRAPV